jgi:hypothetical protein
MALTRNYKRAAELFTRIETGRADERFHANGMLMKFVRSGVSDNAAFRQRLNGIATTRRSPEIAYSRSGLFSRTKTRLGNEASARGKSRDLRLKRLRQNAERKNADPVRTAKKIYGMYNVYANERAGSKEEV